MTRKQLLIFGQKLLVKFLKVRQAVILSGNHWKCSFRNKNVSLLLKRPCSSAVPAPSDWPLYFLFSSSSSSCAWSLLVREPMTSKTWIASKEIFYFLWWPRVTSVPSPPDLSASSAHPLFCCLSFIAHYPCIMENMLNFYSVCLQFHLPSGSFLLNMNQFLFQFHNSLLRGRKDST